MPSRRKIDWPACAARLGTRLAGERLHPAVLKRVNALPPRANWAVALSGGADSLALLLLIWAHWPKRRARLTALHFNHKLRGAASDRDEEFCRQVAASLGIRARYDRWAEAKPDASEALARKARHNFFESELRKLRTGVVCFGHQQDDIVETMLMRLARGSGGAGLAAPRPVQMMPGGRLHLRPLLTIKKAEIEECLNSEKIPWRKDITNRSGKFLRNRIRHDVVPAWRAANGDRDALSGAALSRELIEEDDEALEAWANQIGAVTKTGALNLLRLARCPRAVVRRVLHRWLLVTVPGVHLSRPAVTALLSDMERSRQTRHSLGREGFVEIRKRRMMFLPTARKVSN